MHSDQVPDLAAQASYYDQRWSEFEFANHFSQERTIFILESILSTGIVKPRMCDLGSGPGWLTSILSAFGPSLGIELSSRAVERARVCYPTAEFVCEDVLKWMWEGPRFDIVVSQEVIEHVPDQRRYVEVAYDLLRPFGFLILTTPNPRVLAAIPQQDREPWIPQPIENWLSRRELIALLGERFRILTVSSRVLGIGSLGIHRIVNSEKLRRLFTKLRLGSTWDGYRRRHGYGMYQVVFAQRAG